MRFNFFLVLFFLSVGALTLSQTKTRPPVKGTTQLAGDNGKLGVTYTIGKTESLNITLLDARFLIDRFNSGQDSYAPSKDQKVLLLTYTIQNPNHVETEYSARILKFTAVDPNDENHEFVGSVVRKDGRDEFDARLKPAQKVAVQTAVLVPANGAIPKLMVQHRNGGKVLRYDLRNAVKPLAAPFATTSQPLDALQEVPATSGTYYPLYFYDMKYVDSAFKDGPFSIDSLSEKDLVFFLTKLQIKLVSGYTRSLRIRADVQTEDGDTYNSWGPFKAGTEQDAESFTTFGQEGAIRLAFKVPKGAHLTKLRIWENQGPDSHIYVYPLDITAPK